MNTRVLIPAGAVLLGAWISGRLIRTARYSLRQKAVLITGGSRGLGLVLARHICAGGGNVALIARDSEELVRAKTDLAPYGTIVLTIECDLLDNEQIRSAVRRVIDRFGKIDILINNAGIIEVGPLEISNALCSCTFGLLTSSFHRLFLKCASGVAAASSTSPRLAAKLRCRISLPIA